MANQEAQPTQKQLHWFTRVLLIALAAAGFFFLKDFAKGKPATRADLIGHWVHKGDDVTVDLIFAEDGKFDRHPKSVDLQTGTWGTSIPAAGEWVLQDQGILVLVGAGSFKPFVRGDRLELQAEANSGVVFEFKRKPLPPATRNVE